MIQICASTPPPSSTPPHRIADTVDSSPLAPPPDPIWIGADRVARRRADPAATLPTPHGATPPSPAPACSTLHPVWIRSGQPTPPMHRSSPLAYARPPPLCCRRPRPPPQRLHRASPTLDSATPGLPLLSSPSPLHVTVPAPRSPLLDPARAHALLCAPARATRASQPQPRRPSPPAAYTRRRLCPAAPGHIGVTTPTPLSTPPHRITVTVDSSPLAPPPDPIWIGADRVARRRADPATTLPTPHGATPPSPAPASSTLRPVWIRSGQPTPPTPRSSPLAYARPPPLRRLRPRPPPQRLHRASPTLASATPVRPRPPSPLLPLSVARHRARTPFVPARPSARPRAPVRPRARPAPTSRSHGARRPLLPTPAAVSAPRHLATSARVAVVVRGLIPLPLRLPSAAAALSANRATLLRPSEPGRAPAPSPAAPRRLVGLALVARSTRRP
nr:proteoglycan 4-like [Aegilops tauschii subsp. strangulata]